jgi:hypothetical protein
LPRVEGWGGGSGRGDQRGGDSTKPAHSDRGEYQNEGFGRVLMLRTKDGKVNQGSLMQGALLVADISKEQKMCPRIKSLRNWAWREGFSRLN